MGKVKRPPARYRLGQRVGMLYGPRIDVVTVLEDRGFIGFQGRRLTGIRQQIMMSDPVDFAVGEEELLELTDAELARFDAGLPIAEYRRLWYVGTGRDRIGRIDPLFSYLVIAKAGPGLGITTAYVSPVMGLNPHDGPLFSWKHFAVEGDASAAFAEAERFLDAEHAALTKSAGDRPPNAN